MEPSGIVELEHGVRRLVCPNPSPMTYRGTNTYLLGGDRLTVIDPGPDTPRTAEALRRAIGGAAVEAILVTHAHLDHSPLAGPLGRETGAPVLGFGPAEAGRSAVMQRLVTAGYEGGGEGVDRGFAPDRCLADGETVRTAAGEIAVLHTPGHMGNHLCFGLGDAWFSGDLVMGWATSLVSPPDGDIAEFRTSCARLAERGPRVLYPGHGDPVTEPAARIDWLLAHRAERRVEVMAAVTAGHDRVEAITSAVYADVAPALWPAAARNVFAQLVELVEDGALVAEPALGPEARYRPA